MSATHTKITGGDGFGWLTEDGQFLANSHRMAVGASPSPAVGVLVAYIWQTTGTKWMTLNPKPKEEPEEEKVVVKAFNAHGYDYEFPVAFPAHIALALDIRDLLIKIEKNTQP